MGDLVVIPYDSGVYALHGWIEAHGVRVMLDYMVKCDHKPEPELSVEYIYTPAWPWQAKQRIGIRAMVTIDGKMVTTRTAMLPDHHLYWSEPPRWEGIVDAWQRHKSTKETTMDTQEKEKLAREHDQKAAAIRDFEEAVATLAIVFGSDEDFAVRNIAVKARGDIREALGEART